MGRVLPKELCPSSLWGRERGQGRRYRRVSLRFPHLPCSIWGKAGANLSAHIEHMPICGVHLENTQGSLCPPKHPSTICHGQEISTIKTVLGLQFVLDIVLRAMGDIKVTEHNEGNAGEEEADLGEGPRSTGTAEDTRGTNQEGSGGRGGGGLGRHQT